jgi:hypothetical protein
MDLGEKGQGDMILASAPLKNGRNDYVFNIAATRPGSCRGEAEHRKGAEEAFLWVNWSFSANRKQLGQSLSIDQSPEQ